MSWTFERTHWPHLSERLCRRFRHLDPLAMARFRGDRAKLNLYLAQCHDLTLLEAAQTLDDWFTHDLTTPDLQAAA